jgi:glycosyltransferase involved in cell wall biosynthesis
MAPAPFALTVAVIARDEEASLPRLFASLAPLAGPSTQFLLVDTGSRDGTRNLAATLGAEVHGFDWRDDFAAARNHALSLARGRWILSLDADDVLPAETGIWLRDRLGALEDGSAFVFRVRSPGPDGAVSECSQIRLFPNRGDLRYRNPIHENLGESALEAGVSVVHAGLPILHEGYRDPAAVARKRRRNLALLEKAVTCEFPPPSLLLAWARMHMAEDRFEAAEKALRKILAAGSDGLRPSAASPTSYRNLRVTQGASREVALAARIHLGQCLLVSGRAAEALATFDQGSAEAGRNAQYLLERGKALWLNGRAREARECWSDALRAGPGEGAVPTDWSAILAGAETLLARTAPAPAAADWSPVAELHPTAAKPPFPDSLRGRPGEPSRGGGAGGAPVLARKPADPETPVLPMPRGGRSLDLSVCSIFKDEIGNLPGLVPCLPLSRIEWVVVDTGSKDGTAELLGHLEVKLRTFPWIDDFSAARNESLKHATRGWILWLDADDRVDENFWDLIEKLLDGPRRAYRFVVRSPREDAQGESFRQIRLVPNNLGIAFEGKIHEQLGTSLRRLGVEAVDEDLEILHTGYDSAAKRAAKLRRNHALLGRERAEHPRDPAVAMEYGNCLYQMGDFAGAKAAYLSMLPSDRPDLCGPAPGDEVLRHYPSLLGETCAKLADPEGAEAWFRLSLRWNPSDLQPYYRLGKRLLGRGDVRAALSMFHALLDQPVVIGKVAGDNRTARRNALGIACLCELQLFGAAKAPRARASLEEIIAGGLEAFPLDYRVPLEFYRDTGDLASLTRYCRRYLGIFPDDVPFWEDFLESVYAAGKYAELLSLYGSRPALRLRSGAVEAFRAKSLEAGGAPVDETYSVYRRALEKFPEDPTLLVYFSEFVNHNRLYVRCYADLKAMADPPAAVRDFLRQLEEQGLGNGEATGRA